LKTSIQSEPSEENRRNYKLITMSELLREGITTDLMRTQAEIGYNTILLIDPYISASRALPIGKDRRFNQPLIECRLPRREAVQTVMRVRSLRRIQLSSPA
jgi:hypothetical protein